MSSRANGRRSWGPPSPGEREEDDDLFELARVWQFAQFVLRAPFRRPRLALAAFAAVSLLGVVAYLVMPKRWDVTATVLAQRSPLMGVLSNPGMNREWDTPTRAARELLIRRDNLVALCEEIHFVERYLARRAPLVRAKDLVFATLRGRERTKQEILEGLVDTLESRLWLAVGQEGTVTIGFGWSDKEIAYDVVQFAIQSFMEGRYTTEIKMVGETISILQEHDARLQKEIAATLAQFEEKQRALRIRTAPPAPVVRSQVAPPDDELHRLESALAVRRRAAADLEEFRRQRYNELQAQLQQQLGIYAPEHPLVLGTRRAIEAATGPSQQLEVVRAEIQDLERKVKERGGRSDAAVVTAITIGGELANASRARAEAEDPRLEFERRQLDTLLRQHSQLLERIDAARIVMDTAKADFKYKYAVVTPPQIPRAPAKPYLLLFVGGGVAGGIALALFLCAFFDLRSGRILERWQVEQELHVPLLGEARK